MEQNDNLDELLINFNELLKGINKLNTNEKKADFLKENEALIVMFQEKMDVLANKYLIKKINDENQNEMSLKLKKIIISILRNDDVFEILPEFETYQIKILEVLEHYENRMMYRLRHSNDIKFTIECLEYEKDREEYIRAIRDNKYFSQNTQIEKAIRNYVDDSYERTMFENLIQIIKDEKIKITKRDGKKVIKQIDSIEFIRKILRKSESNLSEIEKWYMYKYASTVIPLKSAIQPESLAKDKLVIAFLNGKIKNEKIYLQIANAIPIEEFESLIFAINLKNTSRILKEIKLGNLSENEKKTIDDLLKKAGIELYNSSDLIEDDENYLVTIQELKEIYENTEIEALCDEKAKFYKANLEENSNSHNLTLDDKKAYAEISIIFKMMTKKMKDKISPKFIEFVERNKYKGKKIELDKNKKLKNQKIRNTTKILLAIIYRDYLCQEEDRKKLIKDERKKMATKEVTSKEMNEEKSLTIAGKSWYQKLSVLIRKLLGSKYKN